MAKILRLSDRIKLTIDEVVFTIAPLNHFQKITLAGCVSSDGGNDRLDLPKAQALYVKYAVKDVDGLEGYEGEKYELEFDNDELTDNCVSELLSLGQRNKLTTVAWQILNGISEKLIDPTTDEELEGVELEVVSKGK